VRREEWEGKGKGYAPRTKIMATALDSAGPSPKMVRFRTTSSEHQNVPIPVRDGYVC